MRRILELDALRGITAVIIMLAHIGLLNDSNWVYSSVDLFFVLSGYFITNNIQKNRRKPGFLFVFFSRRALRIWPAYYVGLLACVVLNRYLKWDKPLDAIAYYLTFTQNIHAYFGWPSPQFSGMFIHTWTLAIEEQFYLLWPALLFRAGRQTALVLILGFVALPLVLRSSGFSSYLLLTRCDGLALGSLLAWILSDQERVAGNLGQFRAAFASVGLASLLLPMVTPWPNGPGWDRLGRELFTSRACLSYFGLAGFVLCTQGHRALAILREKRLCHLGQMSYGLYLYHPLVFAALPALFRRHVMRPLGIQSTLPMNLGMLALCFLIAELSRRFLEEPVMAFKERLGYREKQKLYHGPHAPASQLSSPAERAERPPRE
jgi:peptidoglycan/LPS O-acetylase OafA/YrhL